MKFQLPSWRWEQLFLQCRRVAEQRQNIRESSDISAFFRIVYSNFSICAILVERDWRMYTTS
jgi:hypothetical protein